MDPQAGKAVGLPDSDSVLSRYEQGPERHIGRAHGQRRDEPAVCDHLLGLPRRGRPEGLQALSRTPLARGIRHLGSSYTDAWAGIDTESEYKAGVSSFLSPLNWDSSKRLEVLESRASSPKSSSPTPRHRSSPMACWPPRGRGTGASTTVAGPVSGPTTGGSRTSATRPRSSFRSSAVAPR